MKRAALIVVMGFLFLTSFKAPKNVTGHWTIVKVENNGKVIGELPFNWVTLEEDGSMKIGKDQLSKSGSWTYNKDTKVINTVFQGTTVADGSKDFKIVKRSRNNLTLENVAFTMYLEK